MRTLPWCMLPVLLAWGAASGAPAPSSAKIGEFPEEKTPLVLRAKEFNPFVRREVKMEVATDNGASEELQLRTMLAAMPVTGVIRGGGEVKVLIGNLILSPGLPVPPLIEHQTERLVVGSVTSEQLEINFIENEKREEPRKILIPIDLRPHVTVQSAVPLVPLKGKKLSPDSGSSTRGSTQ